MGMRWLALWLVFALFARKADAVRAPVCKTARATTIVPLSDKAVAIAVAHKQACAVLDTGRVTCWGNNNDQQLHLDARAPEVTPQDVGLEQVVDRVCRRSGFGARTIHWGSLRAVLSAGKPVV